MRSSPALVTLDTPLETDHDSVGELIRRLVDVSASGRGAAGNAAAHSAEEILIDVEVDSSRYLLVRMPKLTHHIQLSPREQEIVRMVAKGHPNKVIAAVLNISSWTVCTHLRRIFAKLGVGSRAAMVAQLLQLGMLTQNGVSSAAER